MLIIEDVSKMEYQELCDNCKTLENVLYVIYYDKKTCLLCQKDYKRSNATENPNFCPTCLNLLHYQNKDKGNINDVKQ